MNTLLEMTEITVPNNIKRIIMCPNHESQLVGDAVSQLVYIVCKHCGKVMGKSDDHRLNMLYYRSII